MKNIIKIFCADFRRLSTNVVAVVVIMGLSVIPSLYAWFNILSNWDPYAQEATSNLKIAVVSQDEGTEVAGISMNIGDNVLSGLKENKTIGWVFPDTLEEATDGVYSGEYYAALVISKDFSKDMVTFMTEMSHIRRSPTMKTKRRTRSRQRSLPRRRPQCRNRSTARS